MCVYSMILPLFLPCKLKKMLVMQTHIIYVNNTHETQSTQVYACTLSHHLSTRHLDAMAAKHGVRGRASVSWPRHVSTFRVEPVGLRAFAPGVAELCRLSADSRRLTLELSEELRVR